MSEQDFNLDLARTSGLVSDGPHRFRITDYEGKMGPKGPYWQFEITVEEGSAEDGMKLWYNVSLSPTSRWKAEEFLDAIGAPEEGNAGGAQFIGATFVADVTNNVSRYTDQNGEPKSRRRNDLQALRPDGDTSSPSAAPKQKFEEPPAPGGQTLPEDVKKPRKAPSF